MVEQTPKSNRNLIIGVVLVIILCCCCLVSAVAVYYGYQAYLKAQEVTQQIQQFDIPNIPIDPNDPNSPQIDIPNLDPASLPQGGLTDTETRYTAWLSVQLVAAMSGCDSPDAAGTTISVLQEPNASGEWIEEWGVTCSGGDSKSYRVTFTPENGIVNVSVEMP